MRFENAFDVGAPVAQVWSTLLDLQRVAPCLPGAEVLERVSDDAYKVGIKVRLGPISMSYRGEVEIVERDEPARRATLHAKAKEARGQGTADASVQIALAEQPYGTHATLQTDVTLSGRAAAMGQGVIADVAARLLDTFAANLAATLTAEPAQAAAARGSGDAAAAGRESAPAQPAATAATPAPPMADASTEARATPVRRGVPVGGIVASVLAGRLRNPRTLLAATGSFAALCVALGYRLGVARSRQRQRPRCQ